MENARQFLYTLKCVVSLPRTMKSKNLKGKRLLRSKKNRMIAGVCAGIGDYFGVDPTVIRLVWVLLTFFSGGVGVLAYVIAWVIIPEGK